MNEAGRNRVDNTIYNSLGEGHNTAFVWGRGGGGLPYSHLTMLPGVPCTQAWNSVIRLGVGARSAAIAQSVPGEHGTLQSANSTLDCLGCR